MMSRPTDWEDNEQFPYSVWLAAVNSGDTIVGYWEWVFNQELPEA